jgi:competence protein ComEA
MLKKWIVAAATLVATMGLAFAQVDVNKADQPALNGVKGIGPAMSKRILNERKKGGDFKDWNDLENRVKGMKEKKAAKLSAAGLHVNGKSLPNAPMANGKDAAKATAKPGAKAGAKADAPAESKTEAKAQK